MDTYLFIFFQNQLSPNKQKSRGRGRGSTTVLRGRGSLRGRGAAMAQRPGGTSLNQRRQQAIQTLLKAKSTLAKLNAQRRKTLRLNVVNQKRGLQVSTWTVIVQKRWLIIFQNKPFPDYRPIRTPLQTVEILMRGLIRSRLIRIYAASHSVIDFWLEPLLQQ